MKPELTNELIKFSENKLISDKRRVLEITAVLLTAIGKFIFMDFLGLRLIFVVLAVLSWSGYAVLRYKSHKGILKYWGFRMDNFRNAIKMMIPFGAISIITFFIIGVFQESIIISWHILPVLITYPIWGSIQQFITIALIAGNLKELKSFPLSNPLIIVLTAILFSLVHYPSLWLMCGTFLLALFYGHVYLRVKNIYAMGLFHGWLGALFYYTVVNRDPFEEIFMKLIS